MKPLQQTIIQNVNATHLLQIVSLKSPLLHKIHTNQQNQTFDFTERRNLTSEPLFLTRRARETPSTFWKRAEQAKAPVVVPRKRHDVHGNRTFVTIMSQPLRHDNRNRVEPRRTPNSSSMWFRNVESRSSAICRGKCSSRAQTRGGTTGESSGLERG